MVTDFTGTAIEQLEEQVRWLPKSDACGSVIHLQANEVEGVADWLAEDRGRFVRASFQA